VTNKQVTVITVKIMRVFRCHRRSFCQLSGRVCVSPVAKRMLSRDCNPRSIFSMLGCRQSRDYGIGAFDRDLSIAIPSPLCPSYWT